MFDIMKMMGKVKEVQEKIKEAQAQLVHITAEGESGGGMVKTVVNGHRKVLSIEIDQDMIKPEDKEMIQDLVAAATNIALEKIDIAIKEEMKKSTEGVMPNIPGFDLSSMMGG